MKVRNFFTEENLNDIKFSLLQTLQYIKKDDETDLQKKYYQIKKFNPKLKGNWYDMSNYNLKHWIIAKNIFKTSRT